MPVNFDKVAPTYDLLSKIVFGNKLKEIQSTFLHKLNDDKKYQTILVLGGGTGWILQEIRKYNKSATITYIESSPKMLLRAKKVCEENEYQMVKFLLADHHLNIPHNEFYDVVITNFYLDVFPAKQLTEVLNHINEHVLKTWIVTDFYEPKKERYDHRFLLKTMFIFFSIATGLKNNRLFSYHDMICKRGFKIKLHKQIKKGFIQTFFLERI